MSTETFKKKIQPDDASSGQRFIMIISQPKETIFSLELNEINKYK
jgi:hypothetical protein